MRLYVGNLSTVIDDARLHELALPFGKPQAANIARYLVGGASKGFGFLDYANEADARAAIAGLNGKDVHGQPLTVFEATGATGRPWSGVARARG